MNHFPANSGSGTLGHGPPVNLKAVGLLLERHADTPGAVAQVYRPFEASGSFRPGSPDLHDELHDPFCWKCHYIIRH